MAFNGVIVDLGQSIPSPHHYLVKFWVPQTADDALEYTDRQKQEDAVKCFFCTITCWESRFWTTFSIAGQIYKDVSASRIVSVWPRLVVIQWGSVPACSAALVDYIWLLGWGLDPSVCVCDRWPGANRQMWPHWCVSLCVWEQKKGSEEIRTQLLDNDEDPLCILQHGSYRRELQCLLSSNTLVQHQVCHP